MSAATVIAPFPPEDGRDWECQCARCGSSVSTGDRGWRFCLSSAEWCEANPLPGREQIRRGEIEWFVVDREVRNE